MKQFPDMDLRPGKLTYISNPSDIAAVATYANAVIAAAQRLGATQTDVPGLWSVPGCPELTSGQLLAVARGRR